MLNKADQFNAADRDAMLLSVRAKMPVGFAGDHVVSVAGEPSPVQREIEDARGAVRIEMRRPSSDIAALTQLLEPRHPAGPRARRCNSKPLHSRGTPRMQDQDQAILPDTIEALRTLSADSRLRPQERASIEKEMRDIEQFTAKLENGRVEIAAFGEVGSGKSALLNALAGEMIFAVSAEHGSTDKVAKAGFKNTKLVLVDTPGINEAAGELRGKLAEETVRYTDLVLFVADGDLNRVEIDALNQLCDLHKPVLLVINKADLYGPAQIKEISESILRKIGHRIGAADIVFAAAAPQRGRARNP